MLSIHAFSHISDLRPVNALFRIAVVFATLAKSDTAEVHDPSASEAEHCLTTRTSKGKAAHRRTCGRRVDNRVRYRGSGDLGVPDDRSSSPSRFGPNQGRVDAG